MSAQIRMLAGPEKDRVFALADSDRVLIGRARDAGIHINDPTVSRAHCELIVEAGELTVVDAGSRSGTFVNGARVTRQALRHADVVQIGETQFRFEMTIPEHEATLALDPGKLPTGMRAALAQAMQSSQPTVKHLKPAGPKPPLLTAQQLHELTGHQISHYWVGDLIARGQSGLVFQAQDLQHNRPAALKVLWPDSVKEAPHVKRMIRSMRTTMPLDHPHLVMVYSAGRTGPYCWVAMEHVAGESGVQLVQRIGRGAAPDWKLVLRIAVHVCRALAFAHLNRILHRNITPANILIRGHDQRAKLGDLMLAKALEGTPAQQLTAPGQLLGDVHYLPPERVSSSIGAADARSDIYSLGASLYAMLAGRPPLSGTTVMETIVKIWQEVPAPLCAVQPVIPAEFGELIMKMLAREPAQRFQRADELLAKLEYLAVTHGVAT